MMSFFIIEIHFNTQYDAAVYEERGRYWFVLYESRMLKIGHKRFFKNN